MINRRELISGWCACRRICDFIFCKTSRSFYIRSWWLCVIISRENRRASTHQSLVIVP